VLSLEWGDGLFAGEEIAHPPRRRLECPHLKERRGGCSGSVAQMPPARNGGG
jgi:hypothetical protein